MAEPVALAPDPALTEPAEEEGDSLVEELRDLAGDVQTLIEAELAFHSARVNFVISSGQGVVVWFGIGLGAAVLAMITLVVGLLLALIPQIGPWAALAAVTLGLVAVAIVAFVVAGGRIRRIRRLAFPAPEGPPPPPKAAQT